MPSLKSFLFGEKPKVQESTKPTRTPEQMALLKLLSEGLQGSPDVRETLRGTTAFPGDLKTNLSRLENLSLAALEEQAMQAVSGGDPTFKAARSTLERAGSGDVNLDEFNEFFRGAVEQPTLRTFNEEVIPELTRRFSGSAAFGSDRLAAEKSATGRLAETLGGTRADMLFKTRESAKDRALTAAGLTPQVVGGETNALMNLLNAGGVPRNVADTNLARQYSEFVRQQESKQRSMQMALALLGIAPVENIAVAQQGTPGFLGGVAQGVGAGLSKFLLA